MKKGKGAERNTEVLIVSSLRRGYLAEKSLLTSYLSVPHYTIGYVSTRTIVTYSVSLFSRKAVYVDEFMTWVRYLLQFIHRQYDLLCPFTVMWHDVLGQLIGKGNYFSVVVIS